MSSSEASSTSSSSAAPISLLAEDAAARAFYVPFTYGSVSILHGNRDSTGRNSYKWTVYVRSPDGEDLSYAIAKVTFGLHHTFPNPVRVVTAPPFAVSEVGWGAFDMPITIELKDPSIPPLVVVQRLAFYPVDRTSPAHDKPVVDDHYDEIVFNELPKDPKAREELQAGPKRKEPPFPFSEYLPSYSAAEDVSRVKAAMERAQRDAVIMKDRLMRRREEVAKVRQDLATLGLTMQ